MLFLKYLDDLESERALEAQMTGEVFKPLFEEQYRRSGFYQTYVWGPARVLKRRG